METSSRRARVLRVALPAAALLGATLGIGVTRSVPRLPYPPNWREIETDRGTVSASRRPQAVAIPRRPWVLRDRQLLEQQGTLQGDRLHRRRRPRDHGRRRCRACSNLDATRDRARTSRRQRHDMTAQITARAELAQRPHAVLDVLADPRNHAPLARGSVKPRSRDLRRPGPNTCTGESLPLRPALRPAA
jgi:hypothetical protein